MFFGDSTFLFGHGARIGSIVIGAYVLFYLLSFFKRRLVNILISKKTGDQRYRDQRVRTVSSVIMSTGVAFIVLITLLMVMRELGLDPSPLLASAGIVGLAISLGSQALMKDVIAGLIILIENQYSIGDSVKLDDVEGEVAQLSLRKTLLRDNKGVLRHVPNGQIKVVSVMPVRKTRA